MLKRITDSEDSPSYLSVIDSKDIIETTNQMCATWEKNYGNQYLYEGYDFSNADDYAFYKTIDEYMFSRETKLTMYSAIHAYHSPRINGTHEYLLLSGGLGELLYSDVKSHIQYEYYLSTSCSNYHYALKAIYASEDYTFLYRELSKIYGRIWVV